MGTSIQMILLAVVLVVVLILGFLIKGERFEMRQAATGKVVSVKRGFSFTYLFFGPFVPLFRGHIAGFFLTLLITLCSCGLGHLILLFCYNGMYINWLANHGFTRMDIPQQDNRPVQVLIQNGYGESAEVIDGAGPSSAGTAEQFDREKPPLEEDQRSDELAAGAYGLSAPEYVPEQLVTTKTKESGQEQMELWKFIATNDSQKEFWQPGAPVILTKMQLFENTDTQEVYLGIGIQNLTEEPITAVYLDVRGFNVLKKEIVSLKDINFLDLCLKKGEIFFPSQLIPLRDKTVRRSEVILRHVVFQNDEIWDYEGEAMFPVLFTQKALSYSEELKEALLREIKPFTERPASFYRFEPEERDEGWYCGCGQFNLSKETECSACHIDKETVFEVMSEPFLHERNAIYQTEQEKLREENERRRREEEERLIREQEERELQERLRIEERNRKIEKLQEDAKEKAQEALAAAAIYGEKGKEKFIELSGKGKTNFVHFSKTAKQALHQYLHEGEDDDNVGEVELIQKEVILSQYEPAQGEIESTQGEMESVQGELESAQGELESAQGEMESTKKEIAEVPCEIAQSVDTEAEPSMKQSVIYCSECGCANDLDSAFCIECGAKLEF